MMLATEAKLAGVGIVVVLIVAWYMKGKVEDIVAHPIKEAGEYLGDQVLDTGDLLGIPRTNETECEKALREGRKWDASFACPAGTFLGSFF
jgi:hypothetical protein